MMSRSRFVKNHLDHEMTRRGGGGGGEQGCGRGNPSSVGRDCVVTLMNSARRWGSLSVAGARREFPRATGFRGATMVFRREWRKGSGGQDNGGGRRLARESARSSG